VTCIVRNEVLGAGPYGKCNALTWTMLPGTQYAYH